MGTPLRAFLWISLALHFAAGAVLLLSHTPASANREEAARSGAFRSPDGELSLQEEASPSLSSSETPLSPLLLPPGREVFPPERGLEFGARGAPSGPLSLSSSGDGARRRHAEAQSGPFGAVGDRAALDLATAFTRGFPQAASADPAWVTAPLGPAGEATLRLEIDLHGILIHVGMDGSASPALRAGIARTVALLRPRVFTADGSVTRLHVSAKITPDEVHDGLHGDVFAIGGSFDDAKGSAFFALAIGRRVDLRVRKAP
jgi:hypothetical protein